MREEHPCRRRAVLQRRLHIQASGRKHGLRAGDAGEIEPIPETTGEHNAQNRSAKRHGEHERDEHGGNRDERVNRHHGSVRQQCAVRDHQRHEQQTEGEGETDGEHHDGQIRARAGHEPAEHIGTGAIGAEPVLA